MKDQDEAPDGRMLCGTALGLGLLAVGCHEAVPEICRNAALFVLIGWLAVLWFRG